MKKITLFASALVLSMSLITSCGSKEEDKKDDKKEDKKEEAKADEEASEESTTTDSGLWTAEVKDAYLNSCIGTASSGMGADVATEYCNCTLEKIIAKYPNPTDLGAINQDEMTQLAAQCLTADMMK